MQPPQVYIFNESSDKPGVYEHKGKEYNETEYKEFCERIKRKRDNSIVWHERKEYPKEDLIITMVKHGSRNPDPGIRNVTLKF